jgi:hypothetical protein
MTKSCVKNLFRFFVFSVVIVLFSGCGGNSANTPNLPITKQFRFQGVDKFEFAELHHANIAYHTSEEIESALNERITKILTEKNLITNDENANILKIEAVYFRRFMGDETPAKSDSLGYPFYNHTIEILDNNGTLLRKVEAKSRQFEGGFLMNLEASTGQLREKADELPFIDAFADTITNSIEKLK